jgi:hypothetical protein
MQKNKIMKNISKGWKEWRKRKNEKKALRVGSFRNNVPAYYWTDS